MTDEEINVQSCVDCQYRSPVEIGNPGSYSIYCRYEIWARINHYLDFKCGRFVEGDPIAVTTTDIRTITELGLEFPKSWIKKSKGYVFNKAGAKVYIDKVVPKETATVTNLPESAPTSTTEYVVSAAEHDLKITEEQVPEVVKEEPKDSGDIERTTKGYKIVTKDAVKSVGKK
jgi:hypothetical protein